MNSVGERLREARLARGLTQEQLARGLATKGFISQVERNRSTPSLPKMRLLAERLGLPLGHLTGDRPPLEVSYLRKSAELAIKAREPDRALKLVEEAEVLATTADERATLLRIKGRALNDLGRLDEALIAHQQAAAAAPPDIPEVNATIYAEIAAVLNEQEHFNNAIEAGLRALHWLDLDKHADPALRARVLTNLGRSSWNLGQVQQAHAFLIRALAAARDAESLFRLANAHMALGITERANGHLDEAIEHCNRALELHARIKQERDANRILTNIGDVHYAGGRLAEARRAQEDCLTRARELHDDTVIAFAGCALARYDLDEGRIAQAIEHAREARRASRQMGDHIRLAIATALLGEAAERRGEAAEADRSFAAALNELLKRQTTEKLAEVSTQYADLLRRRGDDSRAFALMRMAAARDFSKLPALLKAKK